MSTYTLLLGAIALGDQRAPSERDPTWRRLGWLLVEIALCALVIRTQGSLVRPPPIYLLPAGRAILVSGERARLLAPLPACVAYTTNIAPAAIPDHRGAF